MINIEEKAEQLQNLQSNLAIYAESIREVSEQILKAGVSRYPIFIASPEEVNLGRQIIDKEDLALEYSIFASTLEEFLRRGVVKEDKLNDFRKSWKDPSLFMCVFALIEDEAGFVFYPYETE